MSPRLNSEAIHQASSPLHHHRLLLPLTCTLLSHCILPMPLEQEAPIENLPPSYNTATLTPSPEQLVDYDPELSGGAPLEFFLGGLEDPNIEDALFWRVFLNYQGIYYHPIHRSNRGAGLVESQRTRGIRFQVDPCLDFRVFGTEGPHRVELIVSDRPFLFEEDDTREERPNQALPDDAKNFTVRWFLRFLDGKLMPR